ncbi:DNA-directed RNA polymerase III subunit RPC9 [Neocloeon triangulifer]|uniref:DNA-directed RNA polymerase III subunit RPC9 n=1 Tax=Neocloeon triangulifer TaxID=2078957 RepID=UPI00286F0B8F|nr:DNA-directed RNA polymerase III subunit RPC9 [Neocloeon triangulifer]
MEIVPDEEVLLSNFEVLQILKESQSTTGVKNRKDPLATIRYETLEYFKRSPCYVQNEECIKSLVTALKPYKLTKREFLSILNSRPTAPADLAPLLNESEDHITDENMTEIVQLIAEILPAPK